MRAFLALLTVLVLTLPAVSIAENGFYVGAGAGAGRMEADWADLGVHFDASGLNPGQEWVTGGDELTGTDVTWQAFVGWRFLNFLAVEAGWLDLGEVDDSECFLVTSGDDAGSCRDQEWTTTAETDGWQLSVLGIWPINETWEVFGRIGYFFWDMDTQGEDRVSERIFAEICPTANNCQADRLLLPSPSPEFIYRGPFTESRSLDGEDLALGIGTTVNVTEHISLRGEFEWFDVDVTDTLWMLSLSAVYTF